MLTRGLKFVVSGLLLAVPILIAQEIPARHGCPRHAEVDAGLQKRTPKRKCGLKLSTATHVDWVLGDQFALLYAVCVAGYSDFKEKGG
jgi:hypothetical protein